MHSKLYLLKFPVTIYAASSKTNASVSYTHLLGQNETEAAHIVSQIRERAFRESAHPEKATVDAAWLKGDTHINYCLLYTSRCV